MKTNQSDSAVKEICNKVMQGVAALIQQSDKKVADYGQATEAIKAEVKAFLLGDEYREERECLLRRSLPEQTIFASVCLGAFSKIQLIQR